MQKLVCLLVCLFTCILVYLLDGNGFRVRQKFGLLQNLHETLEHLELLGNTQNTLNYKSALTGSLERSQLLTRTSVALNL